MKKEVKPDYGFIAIKPFIITALIGLLGLNVWLAYYLETDYPSEALQ